MELKSISITGLFGYKNLHIPMKSNKSILVGENGSGKTTIVTLIYYALTCQWSKLVTLHFTEIVMQIDNETISIGKSEVESYLKIKNATKDEDSVNNYILKKAQEVEFSENKSTEDLVRSICSQMNMPSSLVDSIVSSMKDMDLFAFRKISEKANILTSHASYIFFMPTYRRIEKEIETIYPELSEELSRIEQRRSRAILRRKTFTEIVKFGMKDVSRLVDQTLSTLRISIREKLNDLTAEYLKFVIEDKGKKPQKSFIRRFPDDVIHKLFRRIQHSDQHLIDPSIVVNNLHVISAKSRVDAIDNVVLKYLTLLLKVDKEQSESELPILTFVNTCNKYLVDKKFQLNQAQYELYIINLKTKEVIEFEHLSSGEKQIVSIFAHLILGNVKSYYIVFDEPELSLSVDWQKIFLEDISKLQGCEGLIAVTHSPFIFQNSLDNCALSIEESIVNA